jgi:hypothetical protein
MVLSNKEGTNMNKIKVLYCPAWAKPEISEIENTLGAMQELVGGYIEVVTLQNKPELVLVCDEEGLLKQRSINLSLPDLRQFRRPQTPIVGDCFICSANEEGEFVSIPEEAGKKLLDSALNNEEYVKYIKKMVSKWLT